MEVKSGAFSPGEEGLFGWIGAIIFVTLLFTTIGLQLGTWADAKAPAVGRS